MGRGVVDIQDLIDDANCYRKVRELRWPEGVHGARFAVMSTASGTASIPPKSSVSDTIASPAGVTSTI